MEKKITKFRMKLHISMTFESVLNLIRRANDAHDKKFRFSRVLKSDGFDVFHTSCTKRFESY